MPKGVLKCVQMAQREIYWLKGELQRVEQDIKDRDREAATTERDSAIAQMGNDRLDQEMRNMMQQLSTLLAQLAIPAGEVLAAVLR